MGRATKKGEAARRLSALRRTHTVQCAVCGAPAKSKHPAVMYCGNTCKVKAYRDRKRLHGDTGRAKIAGAIATAPGGAVFLGDEIDP